MNRKPYEERTDLERLQSQWTKLTGLHSREEWSAAVVRAATAAEIAANFAIRREFALRGEDDETLVDTFLKAANGLFGKLEKLLLPLLGGRDRRTELRKLKELNQLANPQDVERLRKFDTFDKLMVLAQDINRERNAIVHSGQFRDESDSIEIIEMTRGFVEELVQVYEAGFKLVDKVRSTAAVDTQTTVALSLDDVETLLTSLEYSRLRVRDTPDTPYQVRQDSLSRLDVVAAKLREARASSN